MDIHKIRHENLIYIVKNKCNGRQAERAKKTELDKYYINALIHYRRHMGLQTAQKIEETFGLTEGFMSIAQSWSMFYEEAQTKIRLKLKSKKFVFKSYLVQILVRFKKAV